MTYMRDHTGVRLDSIEIIDTVKGDARYMPSGGGLSTLTATPLVWAHRFGGNYAPEDSLEAGRMAFSLGADALDTDAWVGSDSSCPIMHDSTIDRTTTSSGNSNDLAAGVVAQLLTKDDLVPGWGSAHVPTFGDLCREFGNRVVLSVESKVVGAAAALVAIAQRYRIDDDHLFWQSFTLSECDVFVAAGYSNVCALSGDGSVSAATCVSKGYSWIGLDSTQSTPDQIAAYHAAGIKVGVFVVNKQTGTTSDSAGPWIAAGVDMLWSDDYAYVTDRQTPRTSDPYASKAIWPGQFISAARTSIGVWSGVDEWGFDDTPTNADVVMQGWATPTLKAKAGTVQIDATWVMDAFNGADATLNFLVFALANSDQPWLNSSLTGFNGYSFLVRGDGSLRIYRIDNGVSTSLGNVAGTAPTLETWAPPLRINLNKAATSLKISSPTDTGAPSKTVTDTTYDFADLHYLHVLRNKVAFRLKDITLS